MGIQEGVIGNKITIFTQHYKKKKKIINYN